MAYSEKQETEFNLLADKLEKPARLSDDLLVEAVGNDDGQLRDAIYRITFCNEKDLVSAQQSLFNAFSSYFNCEDEALEVLSAHKEQGSIEAYKAKRAA